NYQARVQLQNPLHGRFTPRPAFIVLALQGHTVNLHTRGRTGRLEQRKQTPVLIVGNALDGRKPMFCMRVAKKNNCCAGVTIAVFAL
ncbi:MAG: hypothetical protein WA239_06215, partial [Candidatus Sulfotelmatobacter sp.]